MRNAVAIHQLRCAAPNGRVVLDLTELRIQRGEHVAIVGANGAGKSTLLRCLGGFATPVAGQVHVLGHLMSPGMPRPDLRHLRAQVAQVLQGLHMVPRLTALDNVLIGALGRLSGWRSWARCHHRTDVAQALQALEAVGLAQRGHERADRLSGGERQKLSIARMLMQQPHLILADEPTASLDPDAAIKVCKLLRQAATDAGATLITVVHQPDLLPLLADRVIGLEQGRMAFDHPLARLDDQLLSTLYANSACTTP